MAAARRALEVGIALDPTASRLDEARMLARRADELGFDVVGVQDHPYQRRFLDTFSLIADLLARTERIRIFPDVANLPLRAPAMLAKQAASLDVLSGGRFELGLGAGAAPEAVAAMGGPRRSPGRRSRRSTRQSGSFAFAGAARSRSASAVDIYSVRGLKPGPPPAHPIGIWVGALRPRSLALVGRLADGWVPSVPYAPPARVPELQARIDDAALAAGRDPAEIRRVYNLMGTITSGERRGPLEGPPEHWVEELGRFVRELGFDTLVFWPRDLSQLDRFAAEVVPALRRAVATA